MAYYAGEGEVWKCRNHPSKRRSSGVCPICLRDRLITLCPDCANVRPCTCSTTSSSSSSSASFSRSSGLGPVGHVSNLVDSEPPFRRSRSVAVQFLRSRVAGDTDSGDPRPPRPAYSSKSTFWSVFKFRKGNKREDDEAAIKEEVAADDNYPRWTMMRSKSVSLQSTSAAGSSSAKSKGWYFSTPMKVLRHSKTSKVVQERSPLYRG